jgi:orotate phosphoribosyltransferase
MTQDWLARFRRFGAVRDGHFLLTSGLHSPTYVQCALILQHPEEAAALGAALADRVRGLRPEVIVGPALGGIIVAYELARALGCRAIFAERADGRMQLRRGFSISPGERAILVEDVVTTGGSIGEVAALVRSAGGIVVGCAALVDRRGLGDPRSPGERPRGITDPGTPLDALITLDLPVYASSACPLCQAGVPVEKPGSRPRPVTSPAPGSAASGV